MSNLLPFTPSSLQYYNMNHALYCLLQKYTTLSLSHCKFAVLINPSLHSGDYLYKIEISSGLNLRQYIITDHFIISWTPGCK